MRCFIISLLLLSGLPVMGQAVDFQTHVLPILRSKCFKCHQETKVLPNGESEKAKGGLRLDSARAIAIGGDNGPIVFPRKAKDSPMYEVVTLPAGDPDIMPPKGDPLTKQQQFAIGKWIHEGARFGSWRGNENGLPANMKPKPRPGVASSTTKETDVFQEVSGGTGAAALRAHGATVMPVSKGSTLLIVDYASEAELITDKHLEGIESLAAQVLQLNLYRTQVTDAAMEEIAKLTKLEYLNLGQTQVTSAGMSHLRSLPNLQYLNLYGTKVNDEALPFIASLKKLESVFFYETEVSERGADKLRAALPKAKINID
ncbi:MAG: hypothetical protein ACI9QL_004103 [Candidatus Omnitrophota bacterium]|jgi:hypothetical protein